MQPGILISPQARFTRASIFQFPRFCQKQETLIRRIFCQDMQLFGHVNQSFSPIFSSQRRSQLSRILLQRKQKDHVQPLFEHTRLSTNNELQIQSIYNFFKYLFAKKYSFQFLKAINSLMMLFNSTLGNYKMQNQQDNKIIKAYQESQQLRPLFDIKYAYSSLPLTFEDSLSPFPDHPSCAIGILTSEAEWGSKRGIAFVVEDNYLLTCASNCYSHQHGQYTSITFTINSNRKHGYDTHKVTKVFIPQKYKTLPQGKRNQYNYALFFVQCQSNMKDKYGKIGINFNQNEIVNAQQEYIKIKQSYLQDYFSRILLQQDLITINGHPLLSRDEAIGLVFIEEVDKKSFYLRFNEDVHSQLAQWIKVPKGSLDFLCLSADEMDVGCLRNMEIRPIYKISFYSCEIDVRCCSFFQELPFSEITEFQIFGEENSRIIFGDMAHFLRPPKFKNIKHLKLNDLQIGSFGCQLIASLSMCNLRQLLLNNNPIGNQGCKHLSKADWPFLMYLDLEVCEIGNEGIRYLIQPKRRNLLWFNLQRNKFDNDVSKVFQKVDLPRINYLAISGNSISALALAFLYSSSWKRLKQLSLSGNRIRSKGCKIIKEAGLVLQQLFLNQCLIYSVGIKWICKANLTKLTWLEVRYNSLGDKGCFILSRTHMPYLDDINLQDNDICSMGMKWLLEARWAEQAVKNSYNFRQLIKSFGRPEFESLFKV